ncbi:hypothetical protein BEH94_08640 [Candidatus Altiarchaeales archaeon WOR_SM1_SCG]|nr:hypothetical protein BEH94_08640 [Candidatus Altiarchaeales archaeon WOR_SM1_SCG]
MTSTHKQSKEIKLKKNVEKYKNYLKDTEIINHKNITSDQKASLIDLVNRTDTTLRTNRQKLEKKLKTMRGEYISFNQESKIKINPKIKIMIQSRLPIPPDLTLKIDNKLNTKFNKKQCTQ